MHTWCTYHRYVQSTGTNFGKLKDENAMETKFEARPYNGPLLSISAKNCRKIAERL